MNRSARPSFGWDNQAQTTRALVFDNWVAEAVSYEASAHCSSGSSVSRIAPTSTTGNGRGGMGASVTRAPGRAIVSRPVSGRRLSHELSFLLTRGATTWLGSGEASRAPARFRANVREAKVVQAKVESLLGDVIRATSGVRRSTTLGRGADHLTVQAPVQQYGVEKAARRSTGSARPVEKTRSRRRRVRKRHLRITVSEKHGRKRSNER